MRRQKSKPLCVRVCMCESCSWLWKCDSNVTINSIWWNEDSHLDSVTSCDLYRWTNVFREKFKLWVRIGWLTYGTNIAFPFCVTKDFSVFRNLALVHYMTVNKRIGWLDKLKSQQSYFVTLLLQLWVEKGRKRWTRKENINLEGPDNCHRQQQQTSFQMLWRHFIPHFIPSFQRQ